MFVYGDPILPIFIGKIHGLSKHQAEDVLYCRIYPKYFGHLEQRNSVDTYQTVLNTVCHPVNVRVV